MAGEFLARFLRSAVSSPRAIAAFTNSVKNVVANAVSGAWQYTKEGTVLLENAVAGAATEVYTFGVDNAITISNEVVNTADIVEQSITSTLNTVSNIAVSGASFVASGVQLSRRAIHGHTGEFFRLFRT